MPNSAGNKELMDVLLLEYDKCYDKIIYYDGQAYKAIENFLLAVGVLAAICTFAFDKWMGNSIMQIFAFFLLDFGIIIVNFILLVSFWMAILCVRLGGYMKHLEQRINEIVVDDVLCWETKIAPRFFHKFPATIIVYSFIGFFIIVSTIAAIIVCTKEIFPYQWLMGVIVFLFILFEYLFAIMTVISLKKSHETIYLISQSKLPIL